MTRSPHAHAAILGIDVGSVLGRGGVLDVLTAADLPGVLCYGPARADRPVLAAGVVRYCGEPVAAVLSDDPDLAASAAAALVVSYRELPAVWAHQAERADPIHPDGTVLRSVALRRGTHGAPVDWSLPPEFDPDEPGYPHPVAGADVVVASGYALGFEGLATGPDVTTTAVPDEGDGVLIEAPRAWSAADRDQIAMCLAMDPELVRVRRAPGPLDCSGDLGSAVVAAVLALRHKRPVQLVRPAQSDASEARVWMRYRHHATADGRLVAVQADLRIDVGPYAGAAESMVAEVCAAGVGPYRVPSVEIDVLAVRTTSGPAPEVDAAGAVAAGFAVEAQLDRIADRLGLDRREVRLRNALDLDDPLPTGQVTLEPWPVPALLGALDAVPLPQAEPASPELSRGIAIGISMVPWGAGEGADPPAGATVRFAGGAATVWCPGAEHNGTLRAAAAGVAAAAFGVPATLDPSGDEAPRAAAPTVGLAVQAAIDELTLPARQRLAGRVGMSAGLLRVAEGRLRSFDGVLDLAVDAAMAGDPEEASARVVPAPSEPLDHEGQGDAFPGYSVAVCRAVLDLDPDGGVEIVQLLIAANCGRVLDADRLRVAVTDSARTGLRLAMPRAVVRDGAVALVHLHEGPVPKGAAGVATAAVAAALRAAVTEATGSDPDVLPVPGVGWREHTAQVPDGAS